MADPFEGFDLKTVDSIESRLASMSVNTATVSLPSAPMMMPVPNASSVMLPSTDNAPHASVMLPANTGGMQPMNGGGVQQMTMNRNMQPQQSMMSQQGGGVMQPQQAIMMPQQGGGMQPQQVRMMNQQGGGGMRPMNGGGGHQQMNMQQQQGGGMQQLQPYIQQLLMMGVPSHFLQQLNPQVLFTMLSNGMNLQMIYQQLYMMAMQQAGMQGGNQPTTPQRLGVKMDGSTSEEGSVDPDEPAKRKPNAKLIALMVGNNKVGANGKPPAEPTLRFIYKGSAKVSDASGLREDVPGTFVTVEIGDEKFQTTTKWNEPSPFWAETFDFPVKEDTKLLAKLWREPPQDPKKKKKNKKKGLDIPDVPFVIGQATFTFDKAFNSPKAVMQKMVLTTPQDCPAPSANPLSMRIELAAQKTPILGEHLYHGIIENLFLRDKEYFITRLLSNPASKVSPADATKMAKFITELAESQDKAVPLLCKLVEDEVERTTSTAVLFRGNTIACKAVDEYIRLVAMPWTKCLRPGAEYICANDMICELDKGRLDKRKDHNDLDENILNLHTMLGPQVAAILNGAGYCPRNMKVIFNRMRHASVKRFPNDPKVAWTSISGLVFLRFFVPALRTPVTFGLIDKLPSTNAERNFLIVASVLQKLANIKVYDTDQLYWYKLNRWIGMNSRVLKEFVDSISLKRVPEAPIEVFEVPFIDVAANCGRLFPYLEKYRSLFEEHKENKFCQQLLNELDRVRAITDGVLDAYNEDPDSVLIGSIPREKHVEETPGSESEDSVLDVSPSKMGSTKPTTLTVPSPSSSPPGQRKKKKPRKEKKEKEEKKKKEKKEKEKKEKKKK